MPDVSPAVIPAGRTGTGGIQGGKIAGICGVAHDYPSPAGHDCSVPGNPGGKDTVKHVYTARHPFPKRVRRPHSHEIPGLLLRKQRDGIVQNFIHQILRFADTETSHRVPGEIHCSQLPGAFFPQFTIGNPLHNTKKSLLRVVMRLAASLRPPGGSFLGFFGGPVRRRVRKTLVKSHYYIRPQFLLDLHYLLRGEKMRRPVNMGTKDHSFFFHFGKGRKAENLKTTAVREDRPRPIHKGVQTARFFDNVTSRPQVKMISVAENNGQPDLPELFGGQSLYCRSGPNGHKNRGRNLSMSGEKPPATASVFPGFVFHGRLENASLLSPHTINMASPKLKKR